VKFDRTNVRHFGFTFGAHFCMGAHLARRELEIALREWLARVPLWRIKPGTEPKTHGGHTFGCEDLQLEW
jgi:cytochrome P450